MTHEERLEKELRRWAVSYRGDHFQCDVCTGKWGRYSKVERHTHDCVLRKDGDALAEPPPEIPF